MPFSKEEREAWHRAKLEQEYRPPFEYRPPAAAVCIHCGRPFGWAEGTITDDYALCDGCDAD